MLQSPERPCRIVVIGGGAGGLELAIRAARATRLGRRAEVTLVDRRSTHLWKPRLHEVAAGLLVPAEEEAGYAAQARSHGFDFVLGNVEGIDVGARRLHIGPVFAPESDPVARARERELLPARSFDYDIAVLAIGSTANDFGTPGVREHAYSLDTPEDAQRVHRALLAQAARVKAGVQDCLRVVIVGAGTTGVELAAELRNSARRLAQYRSLIDPSQLSVTVIDAADRALPGAAPALSDYAARMLQAHGSRLVLGAKVIRVSADAVELEGGRRCPADLIVWASGVKAEQLATPLEGLKRVGAGRIAVDERLRALDDGDAPVPGLYCIGDCSAFPTGAEGKPLGATAQAAAQQAQLLARSLARQLRGRDALAFRFRYKGTLVSLGEGQAVGDLPTPIHGGGLKVSGVGAKIAYTGLYQAHLAELFGWPRTAALTLSGFLRHSAQPSVKLYW